MKKTFIIEIDDKHDIEPTCESVKELLEDRSLYNWTATVQHSPPMEVKDAEAIEIDFGNHVKARIERVNGEYKVTGAMNGYGDAIPEQDIKIKPTEPTLKSQLQPPVISAKKNETLEELEYAQFQPKPNDIDEKTREKAIEKLISVGFNESEADTAIVHLISAGYISIPKQEDKEPTIEGKFKTFYDKIDDLYLLPDKTERTLQKISMRMAFMAGSINSAVSRESLNERKIINAIMCVLELRDIDTKKFEFNYKGILKEMAFSILAQIYPVSNTEMKDKKPHKFVRHNLDNTDRFCDKCGLYVTDKIHKSIN